MTNSAARRFKRHASLALLSRPTQRSALNSTTATQALNTLAFEPLLLALHPRVSTSSRRTPLTFALAAQV